MTDDEAARIERFRRLLALRAEGLTFPAIAALLHLSPERTRHLYAQAQRWHARQQQVARRQPPC
jgi:DNA-binding transcriptional MerR regulator